MGEVVVITSGKGGVGKTTATANIGTALAGFGHKVVLVDADIGLRNLDVVLGLENRIVYHLVDVVRGRCRLRQALIKDKRYDNLFLLPAAQTEDKTAVSPEEMHDLCRELGEEFEWVIVDSPAGIEQGFRNAVAGAQKAIVITTPEVSAVRDADRVIGLLAGEFEIRDPKLVLNRIRPRMVRYGDMMSIEDVIDILAIDLLGVIPEDEQVVVATNRGETVVQDPRSRSGEAFRNIARRMKGEAVPLMNLDREGGLVERLRRLMGFR